MDDKKFEVKHPRFNVTGRVQWVKREELKGGTKITRALLKVNNVPNFESKLTGKALSKTKEQFKPNKDKEGTVKDGAVVFMDAFGEGRFPGSGCKGLKSLRKGAEVNATFNVKVKPPYVNLTLLDVKEIPVTDNPPPTLDNGGGPEEGWLAE